MDRAKSLLSQRKKIKRNVLDFDSNAWAVGSQKPMTQFINKFINKVNGSYQA